MSIWTQQLSVIVIRNPDVDSFLAMVGGGGGSANNSRLPVQLKPRAQRTRTAQQIAVQIRQQISRFPGVRAFVGLPPSLQIGGRQGNQNYSLMLQALNTDELYTGRRSSNRRSSSACRKQSTCPTTWR
jgi:multidrug efflux pump subunit AcrB